MYQPLISIIIPTYNRAHLISETLESILAQTYTNWECIIVDDASTDNTVEIIDKFIKKDNRFALYIRPNDLPKGASSCRNLGIKNNNGKYVLFLDSDDLIESFCLENRITTVNQNKNYDFYIFKTQIFFEKLTNLGTIFNQNLQEYTDENYLEEFLKGNYPFCIMSVFWQNDKLKLTGGFDENLIVLEDPDLHINAFDKKLKSYTSNNDIPDSYYRKNYIKNEDTKFITNLLKSKYFLLKKYLPKYNRKMKEDSIRFFRVEVLTQGNFIDTVKYYSLYLRHKIFNVKQVLFIPILILYKLLKIDKIKGLGFYKITVLLLK